MTDSFWLDRPTLVTGATGLLGGWLVKGLLAQGAEVVCLVRDWVPQCDLIRDDLQARVRLVRGDVRDQSLMERALGEYEVRTVFHLAAQTIVGIGERNPPSTFESNIQGTWVLLEACRRSPLVEQIVVASSDKAYGTHAQLPYDETAPLRGRHPYEVSKTCADLIAQSYAAGFDLPVAITRCGNLYGGGDLNWNRIVPGTIRSLLRGNRPIIRSDGRLVRDYFYVEDSADAYMLLARCLARDTKLTGEAFNFSNEEPVSVLDLVRRITRLMDSELAPVIQNQAGHEIPKQFLNAEKARRVLKWRPRYSLDEGLRKAISWYRDFLAGDRTPEPQ